MHANGKSYADLMWRSLACQFVNPLIRDDEQIFAHEAQEDRELLIRLRAMTDPAQTTVAAWAGNLVSRALSDFITQLEPLSLAGKLFNGSGALVFPKPAGALISVPGRDATPTIHGSFVGEGLPIPVRKAAFTVKTLGPHKMAVISNFTAEMANASPVSFELILRKIILEDTAKAIDAVLVDVNAGNTTRPAGLANGATTVTAATGTDVWTNLAADIKGLVNAIAPASRIGLIVNPAQLPMLESSAIGNNSAVQVYVTAQIAAGTVLAVDLDSLAATADLPQFSISRESLIHEDDTPGPISTVGSPNTVMAPTRSHWQTDTIGIRMVWAVSWVMRRTGASAIMTGVSW